MIFCIYNCCVIVSDKGLEASMDTTRMSMKPEQRRSFGSKSTFKEQNSHLHNINESVNSSTLNMSSDIRNQSEFEETIVRQEIISEDISLEVVGENKKAFKKPLEIEIPNDEF